MRSIRFRRLPLGLAIAALFSTAAQAQTAERTDAGAGAGANSSTSASAASPAGPTLGTVTVNASADASAQGLTAPFAGGQVARGGRVGLLGNLDFLDSPFNSISYTQALIQDQQAKSVGDVLLNDPSVRVARGFGNYQDIYYIRGFPAQSDDLSFNGLYGILPRQYVAAEMLERVEVFKGASALLNGGSPGGALGVGGGLGGTVNLLPKRAPNEPLTQISAGIDGRSQGYAHADIARRFGPDDSTGIRINAVRRDGDTGVRNENRELSLLSAGLDWRSAQARLSADLGYQDHELRHGQPSVSVASGLAIPKAPKASHNFGQRWESSKERDTFATLRGEFDITSNLTAWAAGGLRRGSESNDVSNPVTLVNAAGDTNSFRFANKRRDNAGTAEIGLRAKLQTGPVGHTVSLSATVLQLKERNAFAFSDFGGFGSNIYNPVAVPPPPTTAFLGGTLSHPNQTGNTRTSSVALADTLAFAEDRVLLTLGVRHQRLRDDRFDASTGAEQSSYDKSRNSPAAGLVVKPLDNVSLYANYIEGLVASPAASGAVINLGQTFAPYRSRQKEVGVKLDAGRIGGNVSYFTTAQPTARTVAVEQGSLFELSGEQRNRGVEFEVFGEPLRGVRLLGGLTLLDAKQRRTSGGLTDGQDAIGVPRTALNMNAEWDVPGVRGLALNARVIRTSSVYADAANTQQVPSWTRLDIGARYLVEVAGRAVTLRARIDNVANRNYWASAGGYPGLGYLVLGTPRTLALTGTVDF